MRYHILAADYDGTLAQGGIVSGRTIRGLERLLTTGRRLIMVTGRELPDLLAVFERVELFDIIVAENGALLYRPATKDVTRLADSPGKEFVDALKLRGVSPISAGEAIVATWEPHSTVVLETIRDLGLELQVVFNRGAVMILPAGVNKASGLEAALRELGFSSHNVVGIGDAENDHSFLTLCEFSAAVANALPAVKETSDLVTTGSYGAGVCELVDMLIANDLSEHESRLERRLLTFAEDAAGGIGLAPYGACVLICGASASGKSTVATRIVESLQEQHYQFCLVDPEGDHGEMAGAVVTGDPSSPPSPTQVQQLLEDATVDAIVCMTGMRIPDRPSFFVDLLAELLRMRTRYGRPHWLILDEAHHLMPADWEPPTALLAEALTSVVLVTVEPNLLPGEVLRRVNQVIAVGSRAGEALQQFAAARDLDILALGDAPDRGEALVWTDRQQRCDRVRVLPSATERKRHSRKYAEGRLAPERSFYFRGPEGKLNLQAHNLMVFLALAEGIDDETWAYHLRRGDYSRWFREGIKDEELAAEAEIVERRVAMGADGGRTLVRAAIERHYTLPAETSASVPGAQ